MRDKFWLHHRFGLRYDTSTEQRRTVLAEIDKLLRTHAKVEKPSARIRFIGFGASSLDLEVFAWVLEENHAALLGTQEQLLLRIMEIVTEAGTGLGLPSQITVLRNAALNAAPPDERAERAALS